MPNYSKLSFKRKSSDSDSDFEPIISHASKNYSRFGKRDKRDKRDERNERAECKELKAQGIGYFAINYKEMFIKSIKLILSQIKTVFNKLIHFAAIIAALFAFCFNFVKTQAKKLIETVYEDSMLTSQKKDTSKTVTKLSEFGTIVSWLFAERIREIKKEELHSQTLKSYRELTSRIRSERDKMLVNFEEMNLQLQRDAAFIKEKVQQFVCNGRDVSTASEPEKKEQEKTIPIESTFEYLVCTYPYNTSLLMTAEGVNQTMAELSEHHTIVKINFENTMQGMIEAHRKFELMLTGDEYKILEEKTARARGAL